MKNKAIYSIILGILLLTILPFVNATVTVISPKSGTNHSTTLLVNCSYVNGTDVTNPTSANTTFYSNYSGAWAALSTGTKTITNNAVWATVSLTSAMDKRGVAFNCSVGNTTFVASSGTPQKDITFDSTNPVPSVSRNLYSIDVAESIVLGCSCTDTIDSSPVTVRTLTKPDGSTVSGTSSSQTFSGTSTDIEGSYSYYCGCTDYTGNSDSKTITFVVSSDEQAPSKPVDIIAPKGKSNLTLIILIVVAVLVVIIITLIVAISVVTTSKKK